MASKYAAIELEGPASAPARRGASRAARVLQVAVLVAALAAVDEGVTGGAVRAWVFTQRLQVKGAPSFYKYCRETPSCKDKFFPNGMEKMSKALRREYVRDCKMYCGKPGVVCGSGYCKAQKRLWTTGNLVEPIDTTLGSWYTVCGTWVHPNDDDDGVDGEYSQSDMDATTGKEKSCKWAHAYFGKKDWKNVRFSSQVRVTAVPNDETFGVAAFCRVPDPEENAAGIVHTGMGVEGQAKSDQHAYLMISSLKQEYTYNDAEGKWDVADLEADEDKTWYQTVSDETVRNHFAVDVWYEMSFMVSTPEEGDQGTQFIGWFNKPRSSSFDFDKKIDSKQEPILRLKDGPGWERTKTLFNPSGMLGLGTRNCAAKFQTIQVSDNGNVGVTSQVAAYFTGRPAAKLYVDGRHISTATWPKVESTNIWGVYHTIVMTVKDDPFAEPDSDVRAQQEILAEVIPGQTMFSFTFGDGGEPVAVNKIEFSGGGRIMGGKSCVMTHGCQVKVKYSDPKGELFTWDVIYVPENDIYFYLKDALLPAKKGVKATQAERPDGIVEVTGITIDLTDSWYPINNDPADPLVVTLKCEGCGAHPDDSMVYGGSDEVVSSSADWKCINVPKGQQMPEGWQLPNTDTAKPAESWEPAFDMEVAIDASAQLAAVSDEIKDAQLVWSQGEAPSSSTTICRYDHVVLAHGDSELAAAEEEGGGEVSN